MTTQHDTKPNSLEIDASLHKIQATPRKKTICVGLLLLALATSGYALYTTFTLRHSIQEHKNTLSSLITGLKQQQLAIKSAITDQTDQLTLAQRTLHSEMGSLDQQIHSVLKQRLYQQNDWQLLKARYYLELAQINAHWSADALTTETLLQQADSLLENLHDSRVLKIRQAIASELTTTKNLPKPDLSGLLSELDAAQQIIEQLPMRPSVMPKPQTDATHPQDKTSTTWNQRFKTTLLALEKWVIIRHHNGTIEPQLTPTMEALLREQVQLTLQQTQWAVLQHNERIYRFTLKQAIRQIKRAFSPQATPALITQLQALQDKPITQQPVTLNQSLPLLNEWIESENNKTRPTDSTTTEGSPS